MGVSVHSFEGVDISQALQKREGLSVIMNGIVLLHCFSLPSFVTFVLCARRTQAGLGSQWKNTRLKF